MAGTSFVVGFALWIWTYEQLTRLGEGSPSPTAGRTMKLVRSGIYAHSRNPSIFGKLLGVLAVGFALNSFSFVCILVPLLLTGSLIEKVWRQEPQLVENIWRRIRNLSQRSSPFFSVEVAAATPQ